MNKFTIGSKIRLKPTANHWPDEYYSQTWEYPNEPLSEGDITVGTTVNIYPDDFELVDYIPKPDGKHVHYDIIVEWAANPSLAVQWRDNNECTWQDCSEDKQHPIWDEDVQYRFKPDFPTTSLTNDELTSLFDVTLGGVADALRAVANEAIKRYILEQENILEQGGVK